MMKIKKAIPYIIVFLASFFLTPVAITSFIKLANNKAVEFTSDFSPNTRKLSNGIYIGSFKVFLFTFSKVEFNIEDGKVQSINFLKMLHSPGSPYKEDIEEQIKRSKLLEVDGITGATRSSNFAKAAIKSALEKNTTQESI